jgi:hypothetical protein
MEQGEDDGVLGKGRLGTQEEGDDRTSSLASGSTGARRTSRGDEAEHHVETAARALTRVGTSGLEAQHTSRYGGVSAEMLNMGKLQKGRGENACGWRQCLPVELGAGAVGEGAPVVAGARGRRAGAGHVEVGYELGAEELHF